MDPDSTETCLYCSKVIPSKRTPAAKDDGGWKELAKIHRPGCEWVATRAHQVELVGSAGGGGPGCTCLHAREEHGRAGCEAVERTEGCICRWVRPAGRLR